MCSVSNGSHSRISLSSVCLLFLFLWCAVVFKILKSLQTLLWYGVFKAHIFEVDSLLFNNNSRHLSYSDYTHLYSYRYQCKFRPYTFICFYFTILSQVDKFYRLNCVPPKCICWSTNLQCNSIWRWCLWEIIRFRWSQDDGP